MDGNTENQYIRKTFTVVRERFFRQMNAMPNYLGRIFSLPSQCNASVTPSKLFFTGS